MVVYYILACKYNETGKKDGRLAWLGGVGWWHRSAQPFLANLEKKAWKTFSFCWCSWPPPGRPAPRPSANSLFFLFFRCRLLSPPSASWPRLAPPPFSFLDCCWCCCWRWWGPSSARARALAAAKSASMAFFLERYLLQAMMSPTYPSSSHSPSCGTMPSSPSDASTAPPPWPPRPARLPPPDFGISFTPHPCMLFSRHSPRYTAPFFHTYTPSPLIRLSLYSPSYLSPLAYLRTPLMWHLPSLTRPS
mmetsp:Transcript_21458/g.45101  ORF Transcript_21458/g.45101 Transcript_21458/m.45101 type:complete len:248 (-) Transcript_21458:116-859(-)